MVWRAREVNATLEYRDTESEDDWEDSEASAEAAATAAAAAATEKEAEKQQEEAAEKLRRSWILSYLETQGDDSASEHSVRDDNVYCAYIGSNRILLSETCAEAGWEKELDSCRHMMLHLYRSRGCS